MKRAVAVALCVVGCGPREGAEGAGDASARSHDVVVAIVNGAPVYREDVRALALEEHLSVDAALDRLVVEELIAGAATARGTAVSVDETRLAKKVAVQRLLLREVEQRVRPEDVPEAELRAYYAANRSRYVHGELRASVHVLASLPRGEGGPHVDVAESFLREVLEDMVTEGQREVLARVAGSAVVPGTTIPLVVQEIPPLERGADADPAYLEALFSARALGPLEQPVRSAFGLHAIALTAVTPASERSFDEARHEIAETLVVARRAERLTAWEGEIRRRFAVHVAEDGLAEALAATAQP